MNPTISDFETTLNTLKSKYRQELFLVLVSIAVFLPLSWYGVTTVDLDLTVLSIAILLLSVTSLVLGYKKYHGIKPDLTANKDLTIEMKSQVNFLKSVLKIDKMYSVFGVFVLFIYYLYIFLQKPHNTIIISIVFAIILIGLIVLVARWQGNKIRKLEETIKTLENNVLQIDHVNGL